jgi:uncharacterized protein (DUF427 family)
MAIDRPGAVREPQANTQQGSNSMRGVTSSLSLPPASPSVGRHRLHIEQSPKRVRVEFAGEVVADCLAPLLLLESTYLPVYYFPFTDIRTEFLVESAHRTVCPYKGDARYWHVQVGDRRAENAMWAYLEPIESAAALGGHAAFYWDKMDRWLEEDEEVLRHPRDPYHRVDVVRSLRKVEAVLSGEVLARSSSSLFLFETGMPTRYYIPKSDVRMDLFVKSPTITQCPYKGTASYWSAVLDGRTWNDLAWSYEDPLPECPRIEGYMSFYAEKLDSLTVDGRPAAAPARS